MAGHSKWANIKHRKLAVDNKKALAYVQLSKEITVAARLGGTDPNYNFRLRHAIERARAVSMPSQNIQRAIDKTKAQSGDKFEEIVYEGYGPAGSAIIIEAVTNNRNRTASELRLILGKHEGKLGESGCVAWNFEKLGIITFKKQNQLAGLIEEEQLLEIITKIDQNTNPEILDNGDEWLLAFPFEESETRYAELSKLVSCVMEFDYWSQNEIETSDAETKSKIENLISALEENEDVQNVYHNALFM